MRSGGLLIVAVDGDLAALGLAHREGQLEDAVAEVEAAHGDVEEVRYFLEFVRTSERGVCR